MAQVAAAVNSVISYMHCRRMHNCAFASAQHRALASAQHRAYGAAITDRLGASCISVGTRNDAAAFLTLGTSVPHQHSVCMNDIGRQTALFIHGRTVCSACIPKSVSVETHICWSCCKKSFQLIRFRSRSRHRLDTGGRYICWLALPGHSGWDASCDGHWRLPDLV